MPKSEIEIVEANRAQKVSELDSFTPARYSQFHRHFPSAARTVLDVGCNTGRGGIVLKSIAPSLVLTGLDCVPERISALDKKIYQNALCSFSSSIPVDSGDFDVIVGGEFIEHLPPLDIQPTLAEFFRILRLGGRLLLTTPNPNYLKNKVKKLSVLSERSHLTQHYPDCLVQRFRMIGFSNVRVFGSGRVSSHVGERFPVLSVYGSYLISGDKW